MKGKMKELGLDGEESTDDEMMGIAEENGSLGVEESRGREDWEADYDPEEDEDLYHEAGEFGPSEFLFVPGNSTVQLGEQGPGPETAAQRIGRQVRRMLDDDDDNRVTDQHPLAGRVKRKEHPPSLGLRDQGDGDVDMDAGDNPFHPFNSELDWRVAQWGIKDNPGQNALDRLLAVPGVSDFLPFLHRSVTDSTFQVVEKLGLSYHNVRALHQKVDAIPERAGEWKSRDLKFADRPDDVFTVRYRDPVEAIRSLWKDPDLSPQMTYAPKKVYSDASRTNRVYTEMWTGQWWHVLQVRTPPT
jgi:hypothetical protein